MFNSRRTRTPSEVQPPSDGDDHVMPEITRTSDNRKKLGQNNSGNAFGKKKEPSEPGVITRTSDRSPAFKRAAPGEPREKPAHSSKSYAVWLLSRRDYSAGILRNKLILRGYSAEEADEALAFVVAHRYQSDARYAQSLASSLARRAGNSRIAMTLTQKKVDPALAALQLDAMAPENERVIEVAARFKKEVAAAGMTQKLQQRIYRFLSYRGFKSDAIKCAMKSLGADPHDLIENE